MQEQFTQNKMSESQEEFSTNSIINNQENFAIKEESSTQPVNKHEEESTVQIVSNINNKSINSESTEINNKSAGLGKLSTAQESSSASENSEKIATIIENSLSDRGEENSIINTDAGQSSVQSTVGHVSSEGIEESAEESAVVIESTEVAHKKMQTTDQKSGATLESPLAQQPTSEAGLAETTKASDAQQNSAERINSTEQNLATIGNTLAPEQPLREKIALAVLPAQEIGAWQNWQRAQKSITVPVASGKTKGLHFGLLAGSHFDRLLRMYGYEFDGLVRYRFASKWYLESGLGYGRYFRDGIFSVGSSNNLDRALTEDNNNVFGNTLDPQLLESNSLSYDQIDNFTDRFDYLHVPVTFGYQLHRKWAVMGGVRASYLLSARSVPVETQPTSGAFAGIAVKQSFLDDYGLLSKFDFAIHTGINFNLTPRLQLGSRYHRSLTPYIDTGHVSDRDDFHSSVSLDVRYWIR